MTVLFGHPGGNPNSHHAALAHYEAGRLEAFCVPWMPSSRTLRLLEKVGSLRPMAQRLSRRHFSPLAGAPKVQGRMGEFRRLLIRALGSGDERLSYAANDWLMRTMQRECRRSAVTAVHAYEDCSLWQFTEAKRRGKACIYDMPIGYYPAWEQAQADLARRYVDWLPAGSLQSSQYVRPKQKRQEMELADLVLVPSSFAEMTVRSFHPHKRLAQAFYGVDLDFWNGPKKKQERQTLRFIYAGQLSLRKGTPILLEAWDKAALRGAELELVGSWQLAETKRLSLPRGVTLLPPCSPNELRDRYLAADVFVFPSFFEGFGLVLLEAMACGLPVIASDSSAAPDVMTESCGRLTPSGNVDALVENLRWFAKDCDQLPTMSRAARAQAERCSWDNYRRSVSEAVAPFV
jgi:glycosyltransferase involved in cell wall biosynthesis